MGKLAIKADGSETLIYKDNTAMVVGNNAALTGGNFSLVTAGAMENVVLGFLLTVLLGGKLEVAVSRTIMDGQLTKLYGQNTDIGAVTQRVAAAERSVTALLGRVGGVADNLTQVERRVTANRTDITALSAAVGNIDVVDLQNRVMQVVNEAGVIAQSVRTVTSEVQTASDSTALRDVQTAMGTTCVNLFDLTQLG